MEGKKVITYQTDENQRKPEGIALDKGVEGITEKADEQEEMKKRKYIIKHFFLGNSQEYYSFASFSI